MSDDLTVDSEKFDRILGRMLAAKPLSKTEISERIKAGRETARKRAAEMREKSKQHKNSKKLGQ